jgi:hypothetical protein
MAHFAQLDENNVVTQVIVVSNEDTSDVNGNEVEEIGVAFCKKLFGEDTNWKQTSYNNNMRVRYAGLGDTYREDLDAFIAPQPYPSWTLNESTGQWEPPTPRPDDKNLYSWNEDTQSWDLIEPPTT